MARDEVRELPQNERVQDTQADRLHQELSRECSERTQSLFPAIPSTDYKEFRNAMS